MSQYFSEPCECSDGNVKIEKERTKEQKLNLKGAKEQKNKSKITKADLKRAPANDISMLASKRDLDSLKTKVDNLNVGKFKTIPVI